jgi:4-hydroxythreonine-4-phosphate dehydrogenase
MKEEIKGQKRIPTIGITMGDINGIGPEVIIKACGKSYLLQQATLVVYGHGRVFTHIKKTLGYDRFNFHQLQEGDQPKKGKLNVINCWNDDFEINLGQETEQGGKAALAALQRVVQDLKEEKIDALVTAPINKNNIQNEEFQFPGHTEFLTETFGHQDSLMFLCRDQLRVGVATGHIPLMSIRDELTSERLHSKISLMIKSLKTDFGISKPKIAILGLNPHAGEDGLLGQEEIELIKPTIVAFKDKGELIFGPFAADGFFGNQSEVKYDAILAMYHDQGLIPFKAIAFDEGVNFTAGLDIIRTSPDHGTAYGIAGQGIASGQSMRSAIYLAIDIIKKRKENQV